MENTIAIKGSEAKVHIVDTSVDATGLLKKIINSNSLLKVISVLSLLKVYLMNSTNFTKTYLYQQKLIMIADSNRLHRPKRFHLWQSGSR